LRNGSFSISDVFYVYNKNINWQNRCSHWKNLGNKMEQFRITVASLPDRENLVAEITYNNIEWAEISQENQEMVVQFYPHPGKAFWEFPLNEALLVLEKAKKRLLDMGDIRI
jgi:hypothetical protein